MFNRIKASLTLAFYFFFCSYFTKAKKKNVLLFTVSWKEQMDSCFSSGTLA